MTIGRDWKSLHYGWSVGGGRGYVRIHHPFIEEEVWVGLCTHL